MMKKVIMIAKMLSVTLTILLAVGMIWNIIFPVSEVQITVENTIEEETATESAVGQVPQRRAISQVDIEKQQAKLEMYRKKLDEVQPRLEFYESLPKQLTEEEIQEIAQSRILRCYEENIILAVESKTLLMGSLGVSVPSGFDTESATDNYEDYLKEELTEGVLSMIGSENVQNAVRYGIDGAVEAYESGGTLSDALSSAADSVVEGVVAEIQDYPYTLAKNVLDETTGGIYSIVEGLTVSDSPEEFFAGLADEKTGGLVGSVGSIINYDKTPTAFYQNLSETASTSAAELEMFLEKDMIHSEDIGNMMYQYSQFGEAMHDLNGYEWGENYENMQAVYSQFVRNEIMIEMLSREVVDEEDQ